MSFWIGIIVAVVAITSILSRKKSKGNFRTTNRFFLVFAIIAAITGFIGWAFLGWEF